MLLKTGLCHLRFAEVALTMGGTEATSIFRFSNNLALDCRHVTEKMGITSK
jgi:hypothetical protein